MVFTSIFPQQIVAGSADDVVSADFNHDGQADIAYVTGSGAAMRVATGYRNGAFASPVEYAGNSGGVGIAVGDFNADG